VDAPRREFSESRSYALGCRLLLSQGEGRVRLKTPRILPTQINSCGQYGYAGGNSVGYSGSPEDLGLREDRFLDEFGHAANIGTTGAFKSIGDKNYREIEEWEEMLGVQDKPLERSGEVLMEKCNGTIHSGDGADAKVVDSKQHLQRRCCV
jgi:hypothetical protein